MTGEKEMPSRGSCMSESHGRKCRTWLRNSENPCIAEILSMSAENGWKIRIDNKLGILLMILKIKVISLCLTLKAVEDH